MSMQRTACEKCGGHDLETIKEINPETADMNMRIIAACETCGHVAEYSVMSHHLKKAMQDPWGPRV